MDRTSEPDLNPVDVKPATKTGSVEHDRWNARQALAEAMIPLIGTLYRDHGVVTSIYGRRLINQSR